MKKSLLKRVSAAICTVALTVAMTSTCFAASWTSYFGFNQGWYEGADGELSKKSAEGFTAKLNTLGWGGIWGAQVTDTSAKAEKGKEYTLSFDMKSDTVDKWVFVKMSNDKDDLVVGDWIQLKAGKTTSYSKTFKAEVSATKLVFGMGGDFGDRADEAELYKLTSTLPNDVDPTFATTITCTKYSFAEKAVENSDNSNSNSNDNSGVQSGSDSQNGGASSTVQTGDFTPIACAAVAVIAATAIVVFTRKREEA